MSQVTGVGMLVMSGPLKTLSRETLVDVLSERRSVHARNQEADGEPGDHFVAAAPQRRLSGVARPLRRRAVFPLRAYPASIFRRIVPRTVESASMTSRL